MKIDLIRRVQNLDEAVWVSFLCKYTSKSLESVYSRMRK